MPRLLSLSRSLFSACRPRLALCQRRRVRLAGQPFLPSGAERRRSVYTCRVLDRAEQYAHLASHPPRRRSARLEDSSVFPAALVECRRDIWASLAHKPPTSLKAGAARASRDRPSGRHRSSFRPVRTRAEPMRGMLRVARCNVLVVAVVHVILVGPAAFTCWFGVMAMAGYLSRRWQCECIGSIRPDHQAPASHIHHGVSGDRSRELEHKTPAFTCR